MLFEDHLDTESEDGVSGRSSASESADLFNGLGVDAEAKRRVKKRQRRA
jgi:hypothetical protein